MLSKKSLAKILPYVCIESGTNSGWTYKKYADGTSEAWRVLSGNWSITTASENVYRNDPLSFSIPTGIFNSAPAIVGQLNSVGTIWLGRIEVVSATYFRLLLFSSSSASADTRTIAIHALGTWK